MNYEMNMDKSILNTFNRNDYGNIYNGFFMLLKQRIGRLSL